MGQDFQVTALLVSRKGDRFHVSPPGKGGSFPVVGYCFHWMVHGKGIFCVDDKPYTALPGDVFLFRPGQTLQWENDPLEPSMSQAIGLYAEPLPKYWPPPSRWPVRRRLPDNDVIRPLFEFILGNAPDSSGKPSPVLESAIETMMSAFICGPVIRPQIVPSAYPAAVQRVVNSILQRLVARSHTKVTLDDLAAIGGVSREHLCRLFRQYVGYSPVDMVYMYRLTRSLIGLNTGQTVEALAHEFGFADAPHYVRRFIALFGKSPAEMRQAMAKGYKPKLPKLPEMG